MSDSLEPTLPALLDALADTAADVLNAGAREGWSPVGIYSALDAVDLLIAAARQYGGPLDHALEPVPGCTVAARAALRDPLPDPPRPRTNGTRREEEDGTAQFRAWRDARWHTPQGEAPEVTAVRAVYERAVAAEKLAKKRAREASRETLRALDAMQAHDAGRP
ncbi:hypothetical protein ACIOJD_33680 [Streptomyces sp. NPDC088116]|uniref:hypothetical protein n=1 Tax=Streptomyces sp. NPDC088116 TaxID=3365825 RepID=UPI00380A83D8